MYVSCEGMYSCAGATECGYSGSHEVWAVVVEHGQEPHASPPGGGHVGDLDPTTVRGHLLGPL